MQRDEVLQIFEEKKDEFLVDIPSDESPLCILLGGQGAVGKGQLNLRAEKMFPEKKFLSINGDNYRLWHPKFDDLSRDIFNFAKETQIFSNVFTEKLIEESISNRYSFIVEGTMRSPLVPMKTAELLRCNSYETAAFVIAAPKEFSLLNAFLRYIKEVKKKGFGRMIEIESHNAAVEGLPLSLDNLYVGKSVDRICIFDCFARNLVKDYRLVEGRWDSSEMPSKIVMECRENQLKDEMMINALLNEGEAALKEMKESGFKEKFLCAFNCLREVKSKPQVVKNQIKL